MRNDKIYIECKTILDKYPDMVSKYKKGNEGVIGCFIAKYFMLKQLVLPVSPVKTYEVLIKTFRELLNETKKNNHER